MRHRLAKLLTCTLLCGMSIPPVLANPISYTAPTKDQPGMFSGELPIGRIGAVLLPDGLVEFSGDELKVGAVPDWLFDRDVVVRGAIVRAEIVPQKTDSIVAGLVYFFDGPWLQYLGSLRSVDVVDTISGEQIRGRIVARVGQAFALNPEGGGDTRKINFMDIKSISSPRAFNFNIVAPTTRLAPTNSSLSFEATRIDFSSSSVSARLIASRKAFLPQSTLAGADPGISNRSIGMFVAMDIFMDVAPAIAIPLVLNKSTQQAARNEIKKTLLMMNVQASSPSNSGGP